ncbi:MAG: choice-of-anchor D domain-containing protein [Flavobacterium sp.]|nr:choice-of-anchor D domain-containing protein [Flavobacterium sp.]
MILHNNVMEKTTLLFKKLQLVLGLVLLSFLFINSTNAQVAVTKPNLTVATCSFPSAYSTLGNIVLTESISSDFGANASSQNIILTAPTNFEFNTSQSPTITALAAKDITGTPTITINSATQITIAYTCPTTALIDVLTISGINIRAITTASSGNITRTGGNGIINGVINGTILASLNSTLLTSPAQPSAITGSASPCSGSSQTYSVTNVAGTIYNWSFPVGWSQIGGGTSNSVTVTTNGTSGNVTVTPSNTCGPGTAQTLAVIPKVLPTITSTTPNSRNFPGSVTLGATASAGTISWFSALTAGSPSGTGTSWATPSISATTTYYVETNNGSCSSSPRKAVIATVYQPEINIQGNTSSIVNGNATPRPTDWTDFGSMETSTGIITKTFTIQNTGNLALSIGAITISGANASEFALNSSPSASVAAGGNTTFSVRFDPSAIGLKNAAISIANNDSDENPYSFAIQGTGIQTFFDSDGDGVYDNIDIDDDNDGILDVTEEANCNNSNGYKVDYKFLNETFGTGGRTSDFTAAYNATTTYCYEDGIVGTNTPACPSQSSKILDDGEYTVVSKITGTVASDPENIHGNLAWYNGDDHTPGDTNGRMAVFNASFTPGIFYETTITGVLSNLPVTYNFWVLNIMAQATFPNSILPNVTVEFYDLSNNLLQTFNTGDIGRCSGSTTSNTCAQGEWQQFSTSVNLGNVNAFTIRFKNNALGGSGNDLALDDISVTQTLCDLDNDGIADVFDLDADNDGIEDVIEAGLGNMSNGKGKIDVVWADANGNGLHDSAEPAASLPALDSDGDGIPNYIDLDSDNDSLFDVDESGAGNTNAAIGFVNGDGDITGDGRGDGPESETFRSKDTNGDTIVEGFGDGILDMYDYGTGVTFSTQYGNLNQGIANANPATTYLKDTDGDGIPDYLDVMSNGVTFDIANTLKIYDYKTLDTNNNGIIDGTADVDKDGILDAFDTAFSPPYFGSPRDLHTKLFLNFDGRNDYGQSTAILGGLANASLMAWIDLNPAFSTDGVIVGQDKFQLRITSARKLEAVVNSTTVTYNTALNVSQWYNVGATYDGSNLKLYLNGVLVGTQAASGAIAADVSLLTIGKNPLANTKYFKGKIDEVRVFNSALTASQLQRMVYQEIQNNGSEIRGVIVPKNIATSPTSLPFANLLRYYRMDNYKDDIIDDLTTPAIDLMGTKIYNHKNIFVQQAPMPFITERTGDFATAVNSPTNEIRGMDIMDNDYSIVKVKHNITETSNAIDLGMFVDSGVNIIMNNDTKIQNDWYLKLDGKMDLVGKSQLVQTTESSLDVTSAGIIERDQKGQSNIYNYNYWSSPVSPVNTTNNNTNYSINGVMRDGSNPAAPANINWVTGYNGSPTTPISLAKYWLYKFDNYGNDYFSWMAITPTDPLRVGQAFTMKGSGTLGLQNYVFTGKPNNGLVNTNVVSSDQLMLTGNPYPCSLDATAFINDNLTSNTIDGTLYFWEHYPTNLTHDLRDYQGGYAERNLVGGLPPVAPALISGLGSSTRIPGQFIPVGLGFFVSGKPSYGGTITFNNNQRGFHKEDEIGVSNPMFKTTINHKIKNEGSNGNDPIAKDTLMKIRLGFNSNNYHRQVLLGFMNEKATDGMDYGYDALNIDDFPNDMYFLNGENQLLIQGVGYFDINACFPIGVKNAVEGKVSFIVDALENFSPEQTVYIYDNLTGIYNDIKSGLFEVNLPVGVNENRFSLRFTDKTLGVVKNNSDKNDIEIFNIRNGNFLEIKNKSLGTTVEKVTFYNILGQSISSSKIENQDQQNIKIPIKKVTPGVYIAKLKTSKGEISKKVVVFED